MWILGAQIKIMQKNDISIMAEEAGPNFHSPTETEKLAGTVRTNIVTMLENSQKFRAAK